MVASRSFRSRRFRLIKAKKRSTIHRFGSSIRFRPYGSRFCNQWLCSGFWRSLLFRGARSACGFDDTFAGSCWCRCRTDRERPPCQSTRMQILVHHEKACARSAGLNGCAHPGRPRADADDVVFGPQWPPRRECAASSWTKLHPDIPCAMLARHRHPVATSIRQLWRFWMPSTVSRHSKQMPIMNLRQVGAFRAAMLTGQLTAVAELLSVTQGSDTGSRSCSAGSRTGGAAQRAMIDALTHSCPPSRSPQRAAIISIKES